VYFNLANKPKELVIIKNADHSFNNDSTEEILFTETLKWLRRFF